MGIPNRDDGKGSPPVAWRAASPFGILRCDSTPSGRLVRLADLVEWLMNRHELPCAAAVDLLCERLQSSDAAGSLYMLSEATYAKPLDDGHSFAWIPVLSFWEHEPVKAAEDVGLPGAIKHMRAYWGECLTPTAATNIGKGAVDPLAIRLDKAGQLWGYVVPLAASEGNGQPSNWAELVAARKAQPRMEWTPETLNLLALEKGKRGAGAVKAIAGELGVSVTAINAALKRHRKRLPVTPASSVIRIRGAAT